MISMHLSEGHKGVYRPRTIGKWFRRASETILLLLFLFNANLSFADSYAVTVRQLHVDDNTQTVKCDDHKACLVPLVLQYKTDLTVPVIAHFHFVRGIVRVRFETRKGYLRVNNNNNTATETSWQKIFEPDSGTTFTVTLFNPPDSNPPGGAILPMWKIATEAIGDMTITISPVSTSDNNAIK